MKPRWHLYIIWCQKHHPQIAKHLVVHFFSPLETYSGDNSHRHINWTVKYSVLTTSKIPIACQMLSHCLHLLTPYIHVCERINLPHIPRDFFAAQPVTKRCLAPQCHILNIPRTTKHACFLHKQWELIFCLIRCNQTPENIIKPFLV